MAKYDKFIPENKAPINTNFINVYNQNNQAIGKIKVEKNLKAPNEHKLYSFGALADIHLQYDTAREDFRKALMYLNEKENVDFTCVCGDLTRYGERNELLEYKQYIDKYSPDTPVYECAGNHEAVQGILNQNSLFPYTGHKLYYSFNKGNDVFIMFGLATHDPHYEEAPIFPEGALQWLYETLEANRNKRCFVFEHAPRFDGSGIVSSWTYPTSEFLNNRQGRAFISLMEHYKNIIWFHGHSHIKFNSQIQNSYAIYDNMYGCKSIHIPSLAMTREYVESYNWYEERYAESEGYIVDVCENGIYLQGRDFVNEKFLPIAIYWIDTTLIDIPEKTYIDETGIINI